MEENVIYHGTAEQNGCVTMQDGGGSEGEGFNSVF